MVEGHGFRFDPEALVTFADSTSRMTGMIAEARGGLDAGLDLPAGVFGEVGDSSGFAVAFAECTHGMLARVDAVGQGIDGLAAAVRTYCNERTRQDEDTALGLQRAENA